MAGQSDRQLVLSAVAGPLGIVIIRIASLFRDPVVRWPPWPPWPPVGLPLDGIQRHVLGAWCHLTKRRATAKSRRIFAFATARRRNTFVLLLVPT
jgi:hypothetical protein